MRKFILIISISLIISAYSAGQEDSKSESKYLIGFSGILPSGVWPSTALTNMGNGSQLSDQGHQVKSYAMGVIIQRKVIKNLNIFLDMNMYDYNIFLADQGEDVQSSWTVAEAAVHWDEPGAPQILYVHNLPTEVHFDMQTTGIRAGIRYSFLSKNMRPWAGIGYGYYVWNTNYFNGDKTKTYGNDKGSASGLTYQAGIDFEISPGIIISPFIDTASPVAYYKIEGLFYDQWDIDWECPVMGTTRFGITLSFSPTPNKNK